MARTKADAARKAGGKAPRKIQVISNSVTKVTSGKASQRRSGGNPYCPRPTPEWQVPITEFFDKKHNEENARRCNQIEGITESNVLGEAASGCSNTL
ncbi:hypothetical protein TNIN_273131 [Trichonephila inaurata madagascariensis]|uniref:PCNA-associated factor n=1 Tax=Trichonephila inaurata madagascariensis TaxID=2747483 RepID=A0A8X7CFR4_9ARAC|nr:hypothetical protein TNIN_273131 [Trichonephila inaurata madagascariensis]